MQFDIQRCIRLLTPEYYTEVFEKNNSQFLISIFESNVYNLIIPNAGFSKQDGQENKEVIEQYRVQGIELSYYIPHELLDSVVPIVKGIGLRLDCTTRYTFKVVEQKYELTEYEVIALSNENIAKFIHAAELCFPGWNNEIFTRWCLDCPEVTMFGVVIEGGIAAFAGYFSKPDSEYVLLMNAGTLPKFRRQGLHDYVIKRRINEVLETKDKAIFYADVDDGEASHQGFLKLGFSDGPVFEVYN